MAHVDTRVFGRFTSEELATIARLRSGGINCKKIAEAINRRADLVERVAVFMASPSSIGRPPKNNYGAGGGVESILAAVAAEYNVTVPEILSDSRVQQIAYARQAAMWRLRHGLPVQPSYPEIARILRRGDHTTIMHGVRAHEARLEEASERSLAS